MRLEKHWRITIKMDVKKEVEYLVEQIAIWFAKNGVGCNAIIGISGGKDSTVAAGLLVKALGKDRVIGVMMPNGIQSDIDDSKRVIDFLGIKSITVNIHDAYESIISQLNNVSEQTKINLPPRLRMATLYAISQSNNGRVINTTNRSEALVGYGTRWGDTIGDICILKDYFVEEVYEIGDELGLPYDLVHKIPSDGLCGKSDEDNLGFKYSDIYNIFNNHDYDKVKENIIKIINDKIVKNKFKSDMPNIIYKRG